MEERELGGEVQDGSGNGSGGHLKPQALLGRKC